MNIKIAFWCLLKNKDGRSFATRARHLQNAGLQLQLLPQPLSFRNSSLPSRTKLDSVELPNCGGRGRGCNSSALITWKLLGPFPPPPPPTLLMFQDGVLKTASFKPCRETFSSSVKRVPQRGNTYRQSTEPEFVNFYGAQESIPRNRFRQPMKPGGPIRQPHSDSVPCPHRLF
jgi:hypothetical protein